MTDTEQEAIERAFYDYTREVGPSDKLAFTAGYLAHQQAVAPTGPKCEVCNGTGVDENLDPAKLDMVARVLERATELDQEAQDEREHLEEAARILRLKPKSIHEIEQRAKDWDQWFQDDEYARRSKQEGSG